MSDPVVPSVRFRTASLQAAHNALQQPPATPRPKKEKPTKKEVEEDGAPSLRCQQAEIIGTVIPPPRCKMHMRDAMDVDPKAQQHTQIMDKIQQIKDSEKGSGATLSSEADAAIKSLRQEIKEKGLSSIRMANGTPIVVAAALNWGMHQLCDYAAACSIISKSTVEIALLLDHSKRPSRASGGVFLEESAIAPFFAQLPSVRNYDPQYEEALAEKCRQANREARTRNEEIRTEAMEAGRVAAEASKASGGSEDAQKQAYNAAFEGVKANKKQPPAARKASGREFTSYVTTIMRNIIENTHPDYAKMRISRRTVELCGKICEEFCQAIGYAAVHIINGQTFDVDAVKRLLKIQQVMAYRPQSEIDSLDQAIESALSRWESHNSTKDQAKEEKRAQYDASLSAQELAAIQLEQQLKVQKRLQTYAEKARQRAIHTSELLAIEKQRGIELAAAAAMAAASAASPAAASAASPAAASAASPASASATLAELGL